MARCLPLGWLLGSVLVLACSKDEAPIDIPFKAEDSVDVVAPSPPVETAEQPVVTPTPGTEAPPTTKVRPRPRTRTSGMASCCGALAAQRKKSVTTGAKAMYTQAIGICHRQAALVQSGKRKRAQALAQVRGALLLGAPAACR
jgi:hypothetical protein